MGLGVHGREQSIGWTVLVFVGVPRLVSLLVLGCALSPAEAAPPSSHVRLDTSRGPLHVWTPADYDATTADLVIYVHGYYVTVDGAWRAHQLEHQFEAAATNAMFVVCGAPSAPVDPVDWESLEELIAALPSPPQGRVIAIAHSGGHRTIRTWVGPRLDGLVLLDAAYGPLPEVIDWLAGDTQRRLLDVSELTRPWAEQLHAALPDSRVVDGFDGDYAATRILHVRSQLGHMELVTDGVAIPALLRWALPSHATTERSQEVKDARTIDRAPDLEVADRSPGIDGVR